MRLALVAAWLVTSGNALAFDAATNPATLGANALPAWGAESPWTRDHTRFSVGARYTLGRANDHALTPTFQFQLPVFSAVTLSFDGTPFEAWWLDARAQTVLGTTRNQGVSKGDIRFGAKATLFDGGNELPTFAFRFVTKTTTGKDRALSRFTDAPGYLLDVLVGHRIAATEAWMVELNAAVGFFAWQQASGQNDAVHLALGASAYWRDDLEIRVGARGYFGWQRNDKPVSLDLSVAYFVASWLGFYAEGSAGFVHAPQGAGGLGVVFRAPLTLPIK